MTITRGSASTVGGGATIAFTPNRGSGSNPHTVPKPSIPGGGRGTFLKGIG